MPGPPRYIEPAGRARRAVGGELGPVICEMLGRAAERAAPAGRGAGPQQPQPDTRSRQLMTAGFADDNDLVSTRHIGLRHLRLGYRWIT
jgi:hypothetical protein